MPLDFDHLQSRLKKRASDELNIQESEMPSEFVGTHKVKYNQNPKRMSAIVPDEVRDIGGGRAGKKNPYFNKKHPNMVGFADYYVEPQTSYDPNLKAVHMGYANTHPDYRQKGIGSSLVNHILDKENPNVVEWGEVHHPAVGKMIDKLKKERPDIRHYMKTRY